MTEEEKKEAITVQAAFFADIDKFISEEKDKAVILNIIYKEFFERKPTSVNKFSGYINDTCNLGSDIGPGDSFFYVLKLMAFQCFLYCTSTLGIVHMVLSYLCEKLNGFASYNIPMLNIALGNFLFAGILMSVFFSTGEVKNQVIKLFQIEFSKGTDTGTLAFNQFIHFLVYILLLSFHSGT
jgi:hypothetical protein